jgi:hypothetical protein
MPLLHPGPIQRLILHVRPVGVLSALLSLTCLWSQCSLRRAISAWWVSLLPVPNSFRGRTFFGSEHSWRGSFFAMPLLHGRIPFCRRQLTSSWFHDIPGSFPSSSGGAPRPDCRPNAASSVLRPASLLPLWAATFVDRAQSLSLCCRRSSHPTLIVWGVLRLSFHVGWSLSTRTAWHRLWISFMPG